MNHQDTKAPRKAKENLGQTNQIVMAVRVLLTDFDPFFFLHLGVLVSWW
jgi:hypothetical protein